MMNRKEAIEIAERELPKPKDILNANDVPFNFGFGFNEMRFKAIPLLADKIMQYDELLEQYKCLSEVRTKEFDGLITENTELQQKLDRVTESDAHREMDVFYWKKKYESLQDRVLGLDIESICNEFDIWGADEEGLIKILKQKIQEVVEHQN